MLIKAGVDISRLNREIRRGLGIVGKIFTDSDEELVVTSTFEGNHGDGSLHYGDDAFDMRHPIKLAGTIIRILRLELGVDYDVVAKSDHIHIEYDPKG